MAVLDPNNITVNDLCLQALKECGAWGVGQTPLGDDIKDAWVRLQFMLQQWQMKRWLVYHLVTFGVTSTGAQTYTIGPGGDFQITPNPFNYQFAPQSGSGIVVTRPERIESAFIRQVTSNNPNQVDWPLTIINSREDYNRIAIKQLTSFSQYLYYDNSFPLGTLYPWPIPQANIYALYVTIKAPLPIAFLTLATRINLPYEYYNAILYNLAIRLRPKYGISAMQGDHLPGLAKDALNVLRTANLQIANLQMPASLQRGDRYNIFSDQIY